MAASLLKYVPSRFWGIVCQSRLILPRYFSDSAGSGETGTVTSKPELSTPTEGALRKFDKLVEKVKSEQDDEASITSAEQKQPDDLNLSFATMLRKSSHIALEEEEDKRVTGQIIEVMEDDLYIDFGGKFHCVCPRPRKNGDLYQRGTDVIVSLKSQEMSSAFLGSDVHITLLEADAVLLGLQSASKTKRS